MVDDLLVGQNLAEVMGMLGGDPDGRLATALSTRASWSGLTLTWPLERSPLAAPVTLGGVPQFGPSRDFAGFKGFGLADLDRLVPAPTARLERIPSRAIASAQAGSTEAAGWGEAQRGPISEPSRQVDAESVGNASDEVFPIPRAPPSPEQVGAKGGDGAAAGRSASRIMSPNVVPLRPYPSLVPPASARRAAARAEDRLASPSQNDLSSVERSAFDEIARALGASSPGSHADAPVLESPATVAATSRDEGSAKHPDGASDVLSSTFDLLQDFPVATLIAIEGRPAFVNGAFAALTGYATAQDVALAGGVEHLIEGVDFSGSGTAAEERPLSFVSATHGIVHAQGRVAEVTLGGKTLHVLTLHGSPDVTATARGLERQLARREADLADVNAVLDATGLPVATMDDAARLITLNGAGIALFGLASGAVAGEPLTTLVRFENGADRAAILAAWRGLAAGQEWVGAVTGHNAERAGPPLRMVVRRFSPDKLCVTWLDQIAQAETLRVLAGAREEAARSKEWKAGHEVRTPLNAILGFAEIMLDERFGPLGNERYRDYLGDIRESGTKVLDLVNDLLDLSRMEAGRLALTVTAVDVNRIVGESVARLQALASRERVIMRTSLLPRLPPALADERSLEQVMSNILSNAVKFNEPGGQVIVSTAVNDAGAVVVRVRDTGVGMSEGEIATVMEPFRQIATFKPHGGNGLGLPLTKALVEANQASISIKSRKNEGTLVEVLFRPGTSDAARSPAA